MSFVTWKIERDPFSGTSYSGSFTELTNFHDPILRDAIGSGKDTFSVKFNNFNDAKDDFFGVSDKLLISRKVNSSTIASSDQVMTAVISDVPQKDSATKNIVSIKANNYSETLANALAFIDPGDSGLPLDEYLTLALAEVGNKNSNFQVGWHPDNPSTKSTGGAFPTVYERWYNKSLTQLFEKYSQSTQTEDGNYYWYIDKDNLLVWRQRTDSQSGTFDISTDDYREVSVTKDKNGVLNWAIVKGGRSPAGTSISVRVDKPISRVKHGFKPYILVSEAKHAQNLISADMVKAGVTTGTFPTSYNFITSWNSSVDSSNAPACSEGSPVTCTSPAEYDFAIRREVKQKLTDEGNRFLDERGNGKLKVDITFAPGKGWGLGDIILVTIPNIGKTNNPMRVIERELSTTSERYTISEDVGTI